MDILRKQGEEVHSDIYDLRGNLTPRELRDAAETWERYGEDFGPNLLTQPAPLEDRRAREEGDFSNNPGFMANATQALRMIEALPSASTSEEMMSPEYQARGEIEEVLEELQRNYTTEMERRAEQRKTFASRELNADSLEEILRMVSKFNSPAEMEEKFPNKKKFTKEWSTQFARFKDKINEFLYLGERIAQPVREVYLERPIRLARFDDETKEWMQEEELGYKMYNGKTSKEVWEDLLNFLGMEQMSSYDKRESRSRLERYVRFDENNLEELFNLIREDNLLEAFPALFDESSFDDLESALYILIEDVMEMHDDYLDAEGEDENTEENIEKYLTAIEFLMHVFEITRRDDFINDGVVNELKEIEEPRPFQFHREFRNIIEAHDLYDEEEEDE